VVAQAVVITKSVRVVFRLLADLVVVDEEMVPAGKQVVQVTLEVSVPQKVIKVALDLVVAVVRLVQMFRVVEAVALVAMAAILQRRVLGVPHQVVMVVLVRLMLGVLVLM
jgi:hypothetical protein